MFRSTRKETESERENLDKEVLLMIFETPKWHIMPRWFNTVCNHSIPISCGYLWQSHWIKGNGKELGLLNATVTEMWITWSIGLAAWKYS
jgi:hypothetical protein